MTEQTDVAVGSQEGASPAETFSGLFHHPGLGLQIRVSPEGWTERKTWPGALGSWRHGATGLDAIVLYEGDRLQADIEPAAAAQALAQNACERYVPQCAAPAFMVRRIADQEVSVLTTQTETHLVIVAPVVVGDRWIKLLLLMPKAHRDDALRLADIFVRGVGFVEPAAGSVVEELLIPPYDVRYGIRAEQWGDAATPASSIKLACSHQGGAVEVKTLKEIRYGLALGRYDDTTKVFTQPLDSTLSWQPLGAVRAERHEFDPPSQLVARSAEYAENGAAIGGLIALLPGLYYFSGYAALGEALGMSIGASIFFFMAGIGAAVSAAILQTGIWRIPGVGPFIGLMCLSGICAPFIVLLMFLGSLLSLVWMIIVLLFWLLLAVLAGGAIGAGIAAAAGVLITRYRPDLVTPAVPKAVTPAPAISAALWTD